MTHALLTLLVSGAPLLLLGAVVEYLRWRCRRDGRQAHRWPCRKPRMHDRS